MSDADVVREVLGGRHESFGKLVERHFASVYALCLSYIKDATEAEDAAQDAFVRGYCRLDTLKNPKRFAGWLASIARNICINHLKSSSKRNEILSDYAENTMNHKPVMDSEPVELRQAVRRKVDELPPKTREAIYLYYFEEKSLKEIGQYLGKSPNAVARLLNYGRRTLKDRLWDEAAESIRSMRPKKDSVVKACMAIPLGTAAWCVKAGAVGAAAGAAKMATIGGVLSMSSKSAISAIVAVTVAVTGLLIWSPWSGEPSAVQNEEAVGSRTEPIKAELSEPPAQPVRLLVASAADQTAEEVPIAATVEEPQAAEEQQEEVAAAASISGYVMDDEGYAFEGATVTLEIARDEFSIDIIKAYTAQTGADGTYKISGIDTFGKADAYGSAEGYVMQRVFRLTLAPGTNLEDVNFTLHRAAFLVAGRVVSESRVPIPGAEVQLRYYAYSEEGLAMTARTGGTTGNITGGKWSFAITGEQGQFEIGIAQEGLCDFTVVKDGYGTGFFPRVRTGTYNAVFVLRSYGAIAGRVTRANGTPVAGAIVRALGEALPGGLTPTKVPVQTFQVKPVVAVTDSNGDYYADGLGEDYIYAVTVDDAEVQETQPVSSAVQESGVEGIAKVVGQLLTMTQVGKPCSAKQTGVRVKAGETTSGVDFVLSEAPWAVVYGTVTDTASGLPVSALTVCASVVDPGDESGGEWSPLAVLGARSGAVTGEDGSYTLRINLTETHTFRILYWYLSEGGSPGLPKDAQVAILDLGPGVEKELNFTAPAPLIVPVKYVNRDGAPLEGVTAALRLAGGRGGWGGLTSDAEGRVIWHGIDPGRTYEAIAWAQTERGLSTIAVSAPFTGQPGETVPEVVVVCIPRGGIEGTVLDAGGSPVANTAIGYRAFLEDGTVTPIQTVSTDENGTFCLLDALPEGIHPRVLVGRQRAEDQIELAIIDNVELVADGVTNLGVIRLSPLPAEEAMKIIGIE